MKMYNFAEASAKFQKTNSSKIDRCVIFNSANIDKQTELAQVFVFDEVMEQ